MSECTCNQTFRTAEDYRDHLPCDTRQVLTDSEREALHHVIWVFKQSAERDDQRAVATIKGLLDRL